MYLVIVESPAKAKTINKFLGSDFKVLASYGHVRDIEEKKGISVENNFKIYYQKDRLHSKHLVDIKKNIKDIKKLYLATDQDREGEAIAWHIKTILEEDSLINDTEVLRITFNEITKKAILESLKYPRSIDMNLVDAYQARRSLDYLMGFSLSPLLIRKLPGCKSAGRVQSVALKLITERENEIQKFLSKEYWIVSINLIFDSGQQVEAKIFEIDGKKLTKLDIKDKNSANDIVKRIKSMSFSVSNIDSKTRKQNPYPPFITSTLQLDASNKLGFSPSKTMTLAQNLYEGININGENKGLITYMRTDSTNLSNVFIKEAKSVLLQNFGEKYVYNSVRTFKNKVKNSQEAHEAIRPSDPFIRPQDLPITINQELKKLYNLIWRRSLATQSTQSISKIISIKISNDKNDIILNSSTTEITFDGYKKVYQDDGQKNIKLNENFQSLSKGSYVKNLDCKSKQHFTEPPTRYSEASLIKQLEEYGIGRPSTYANIMKKNQLRGYVQLVSKRFFPQPSGRVVTCFLENHFKKYLDYNFTAEKEDELDLVSKGEKNWKLVLNEFWKDFNQSVENTVKLSNTQVYDYINKSMSSYLFPQRKEKSKIEPDICPKCKSSNLSIKMRKNGSGPFVACASHPDCNYIRSEVFPSDNSEEILIEDKILGKDNNNTDIILKKGPYGPYVQAGNDSESKEKIRRASIPKNYNFQDINLETAIELLKLPREVGLHPETGKIIIANNGKYGPYLKYNNTFFSIPKDDDPLTIGINRAIDILSKPKKKNNNRMASKPLKIIGNYPTDNEEISLYKGKYGLYIKYKSINFSLPKATDEESVSLDMSISVINKKIKGNS